MSDIFGFDSCCIFEVQLTAGSKRTVVMANANFHGCFDDNLNPVFPILYLALIFRSVNAEITINHAFFRT